MRRTVLTFLTLVVSGGSLLTGAAACRPSGNFRYVDLPGSVPRATQTVREELRSQGFVITKQEAGPRPRFTAQKALPPPAPGRGPAKTSKGASRRIIVTIHPSPTGSRVEINAAKGQATGWIFPEHPGPRFKPAFGLQGDHVFWELYAQLGWRLEPGFGHGMDLQLGGRVGPVLATWGGRGPSPSPQFKLQLTFGLGAGAVLAKDRDAWFAVPNVGLSLCLRRGVQPVPGRQLPQGWDYYIDLIAAVPVNADRRGAELQLLFRFGDIGGFYVSAGRQLSPVPGITVAAGLHLGTIPVVAAGIAALYAL